MSQLLLINPRRRRRAKSAKRRHRARRHMTAKQLRYFGKRRHRRAASVMFSNPRKRRRARRSGRITALRSYRRISGAIRSSGILGTVKAGFIGGAGAIAVDAIYAQAGRVLPASIMSRYNADGTLNLTYYGAKAAVAIGGAMLLRRFAPRMSGVAAQAVSGSFTVMAYEILRTYMPASVPLGYFNPALVTESGNVTSMGRYLSQRPTRLQGLRRYLTGSGAQAGSLTTNASGDMLRDTRIGEGRVF